MGECLERRPHSRPNVEALVRKLQGILSVFAEEKETAFDMVSL